VLQSYYGQLHEFWGGILAEKSKAAKRYS